MPPKGRGKRIIPQENPNWRQHRGPHVIEFVEDINARRKKRNDRRRTLFLKAHELAVLSGGEVLVVYKDDNDQTWSFASSEGMWKKYTTTGIRPEEGEKRCDKDSKLVVDHPETDTSTHSCEYKRRKVQNSTTEPSTMNDTSETPEDIKDIAAQIAYESTPSSFLSFEEIGKEEEQESEELLDMQVEVAEETNSNILQVTRL